MATLVRSNQKTGTISLLAIRRMAVSLAALALFFSIWQFVAAGPTAYNQIPQMIPPVPTPSSISTNTLVTFEHCEMALYIVQANDTLSGIADQFSVSVEEIMKTNQLQTEVVQPGTKLVIPLCNFTPTGTVRPATFTTTYTPIFQTTFTPDG
jgi:LysM repeat protein